MAEYTYKDIIIDPTSEEAKNCIGKMVYYADNPSICLNSANNDCFHGILDGIKYGVYAPFVINGDDKTSWVCIIPCEEELKIEYVPFESIDEFLDAYEDSIYNIACDSVENKLINRGSMWLKHKNSLSNIYLNVTELWDNGIVLGCDVAKTFWDRVFQMFVFLDGSPCGKIKEVSNE